VLRESWAKVVPIADAAAAIFCERLFDTDPATRRLFSPERMPEQRRKLVQALDLVVTGLDDLGPIAALGRRHVGYGVTEAQYGSVGVALLWTLERGLGAALHESAAAAWTEAYGLVSGVMRDAVRVAPPPAPA